ncbi:hypothetical protein CYMTET_26999, partial [Cymbomonas tetramitiformis]
SPDKENHTLELVIDQEPQPNGGIVEEDEANNRQGITVRFCDWGAELEVTGTVTVGTVTSDWNTSICLSDQDILRSNDYYILQLSYSERSLGPQAAEARFEPSNTYTNEVLMNGVRVLTSAKGTLGVGSRRSSGGQMVVYEQMGLEESVLTVLLDVNASVAWTVRPTSPARAELRLRFCTEYLIETYGACGCGAALAPGIYVHFLARETVNMWDEICLRPTDAWDTDPVTGEAWFAVRYWETNWRADGSTLAVRSGYANALRYDGEMVAESFRSTLAIDESRWEDIRDVVLVPDNRTHTLELSLNDRDVQPGWVNQARVSIEVSFCGDWTAPAVSAGAGLWLGDLGYAAWGSTVWINERELASSNDTLCFWYGCDKEYGLFFNYSEVNLGRRTAENYNNTVYWDGVEVLTDFRSALEPRENVTVTHPWDPRSSPRTGLTVSADGGAHTLVLVLDVDGVTVAEDERNDTTARTYQLNVVLYGFLSTFKEALVDMAADVGNTGGDKRSVTIASLRAGSIIVEGWISLSEVQVGEDLQQRLLCCLQEQFSQYENLRVLGSVHASETAVLTGEAMGTAGIPFPSPSSTSATTAEGSDDSSDDSALLFVFMGAVLLLAALLLIGTIGYHWRKRDPVEPEEGLDCGPEAPASPLLRTALDKDGSVDQPAPQTASSGPAA